MKTESEILSIEVKPGWKKGTKITFAGKGNQQWNQLPVSRKCSGQETLNLTY